ncbi:MAG: NAD(P)/FAD-dependent oxidoreductase [Nitrospirae bacterium]|nr:MAG: NAD(P)/FAD-dependent oxidoreductase [Nitrospirota bacterium]
MDKVNITIIGAGVVGLAIAETLSDKYENILVLEKHGKFGQETSSRNSEVIHSGIYYPPGSLKAKLCVEGAGMLYSYCKKNSIPHSKLGKLIVAVNETEKIHLEELYDTGIKNGVKNLKVFDKNETVLLEPDVNAVSALYSPDTGIIDSHSLMYSLYKTSVASGVMFSFGNELNRIEKNKDGYLIGIKNDDYEFTTDFVINSAGLYSDHIAELAGIDIDSAGYRLRYCKGSYFSYEKKSPVKMLVYPVPHKDLTGLGTHATLDLGGRLRFGPDTEYIDSMEYKVDASKRDFFYEGANKIIKELERESFVPDMCGIRPKIKGNGIKDFIITDETSKGLEGFINLIGIESPGLTASLAIAKYVRSLLKEVA